MESVGPTKDEWTIRIVPPGVPKEPSEPIISALTTPSGMSGVRPEVEPPTDKAHCSLAWIDALARLSYPSHDQKRSMKIVPAGTAMFVSNDVLVAINGPGGVVNRLLPPGQSDCCTYGSGTPIVVDSIEVADALVGNKTIDPSEPITAPLRTNLINLGVRRLSDSIVHSVFLRHGFAMRIDERGPFTTIVNQGSPSCVTQSDELLALSTIRGIETETRNGPGLEIIRSPWAAHLVENVLLQTVQLQTV